MTAEVARPDVTPPWQPDLDQVYAALEDRAGERLAISVLRPDGAHSRPFVLNSAGIEAAASWVQRQAAQDRTISIGTAELTDEAFTRLLEGATNNRSMRPRGAEASRYRVAVADLDPDSAAGVSLDELTSRVEAFPSPPSTLIHSGRGLHCYWRLAEPVDVQSGRSLMAALARALQSDVGTTSPDRALRLAGTWNNKQDAQRLARIVTSDSRLTYQAEDLADLACRLAPLPSPQATSLPRPFPTRSGLHSTGTGAAEELRGAHDLADVLTRVCGERIGGKWRCPQGHDGTASLKLHPADSQRWMCFGTGHEDGFGRRAESHTSAFSGDVLDVLALSAGLPIDDYMRTERQRRLPVVGQQRQPGALAPGRREPSDGPTVTVPAPKKKESALLVELGVSEYEFLLASTGEPVAVPRNGAYVARALRGDGSLRAELSRRFFETYGKAASQSALADAMSTFEGFALQHDPVKVHLRVAAHAEGAVLDLGDKTGAAIVIAPGSWTEVARSPVLFMRSRLTAPLPPPARGGRLEDLRGLLNVSDEAWPLLVGWMVAALLPDVPQPIVLLRGEQGSGKTSAARLLAKLLDPSEAPSRSAPRDDRDWAVTAAGSHVVPLDNISHIPGWLSDALCRAVTGDGYVARRLYTDSDVSVLRFQRAIILTSIDPGALAGDLTDRLLPIELERISPTERRRDADVTARFAAAHAGILSALLDLTSEVLAILPEVQQQITERPRMADWYEVMVAVDRVCGTSGAATFLGAGAHLAEEVVDGHPLANAVCVFLDGRPGGFEGSPSELQAHLPVPEPRPRKWPADARRLSGDLRRLAPALRSVGVVYEPVDRSQKQRVLRLRRAQP